jgi:nicotinamidase-related amidase
MRTTLVDAEPQPVAFSREGTALVIIDMQRDFLEPGGFGAALGNDVSHLSAALPACRALLAAARDAKLTIVHTREGHHADLRDAPSNKLERGAPGQRIGDRGPMGRILIRGEPGHAIVPELAPRAGEIVIDKPGKGAFYATGLDALLRSHGIGTLLVCGVTTEVCVHTTVREGNDRGYRCIVIGDACASYFPQFHAVGLDMIKAQGGIFGWVTDSTRVIAALA